MTVLSLVRLLVLFLAALATGALMVNWVGLARAMARLSSPAYVESHQATNDTFDPYMTVVVVGAALGGIVLAALPPGLTSLSGRLGLLGARGASSPRQLRARSAPDRFLAGAPARERSGLCLRPSDSREARRHRSPGRQSAASSALGHLVEKMRRCLIRTPSRPAAA
jgi:hypothetical protein